MRRWRNARPHVDASGDTSWGAGAMLGLKLMLEMRLYRVLAECQASC